MNNWHILLCRGGCGIPKYKMSNWPCTLYHLSLTSFPFLRTFESLLLTWLSDLCLWKSSMASLAAEIERTQHNGTAVANHVRDDISGISYRYIIITVSIVVNITIIRIREQTTSRWSLRATDIHKTFMNYYLSLSPSLSWFAMDKVMVIIVWVTWEHHGLPGVWVDIKSKSWQVFGTVRTGFEGRTSGRCIWMFWCNYSVFTRK